MSGIRFPTPFALGRDPATASPSAAAPASEYDRKRAELERVVETLLLLPPRHAEAPPFAAQYAALAAKRRALQAELAELEREWA